jgi:NADP-dependent 3-hydroxy acid dehydrogenase YdfG
VRVAVAPDAIGRTIAFAVEPPSDVDATDSIFRPTAEI